jgi:hypothetical protein
MDHIIRQLIIIEAVFRFFQQVEGDLYNLQVAFDSFLLGFFKKIQQMQVKILDYFKFFSPDDGHEKTT